MKYIRTSLFTYQNYVKEHQTNRLSKKLKLQTNLKPFYLELRQIFDTQLELKAGEDFEVEKIKHLQYPEEFNYKYTFSTTHNTYRLDFIILDEDNANLNHEVLKDKKFVSISFAPAQANTLDYDLPTNKQEQYEFLNRVIFLINHFQQKLSPEYLFMFGDPMNI